MENLITIHYSEIALKGKNRNVFEDALVRNISAALGENLEAIERAHGRLFLEAHDKQGAFGALSKVFGIACYFDSMVAPRSLDGIIQTIRARKTELSGIPLKIECSRSDKSFPMTSPEMNLAIGSALEESGFNTEIMKPQKVIYVQVLKDRAIIQMQKIPGLCGLPVGSSGPVLSLLSGGIDSPVASWSMMRRGCTVDYLHVHASAKPEDVEHSKIPQIIRALRTYHPVKSRLYIAPYHEFYKKSVSMDPKAELVVFRRFIMRLAQAIAQKNRHLGVVSGDNIGQVASQTLENLFAANIPSYCPVFRPLLTYDKQEIINLSKKIGVHGLSLEDYKDCCSLVAMKHPCTRVKPEAAQKIEDEIEIGNVIEATIAQTKTIEI